MLPLRNVMPLSRFTATIRDIVSASSLMSNVWVRAELSDVRRSAGHCYMELMEKDASGQVLAKLRANIWRSNFDRLNDKFADLNKGKPIASGLKADVFGSASYHPVFGLSFTVTGIEPYDEAGDIERQRREILARLMREGVLERNKHLEFPIAPQRIAIISASGAAGYGDLMDHLVNNSAGYIFYTHLFEAVMQGERVSRSVRDALEKIAATSRLWDCVVIARGGGATTDLIGFDDLDLARAVATFPLPIVVGIGHERDRTVLDEIACIRVKTPTAVASFLTERLQLALNHVTELVRDVVSYVSETLHGEELHLSSVGNLLSAVGRQRIAEASELLGRIEMTVRQTALSATEKQRLELTSLARVAAQVAVGRTQSESSRLAMLHKAIATSASLPVAAAATKLDALEKVIDALSPEQTLRRGYSITRVGGHVVSDVGKLAAGDIVETQLAGGIFESEVIKQVIDKT